LFSIGSVDHAENHYQQVRNINVTGLGNVIDIVNGYKAKVIYISTNAVFSGKNPPYHEYSPLEPVNSYGVMGGALIGLLELLTS
jgi:dTDP-4-dehydrorhamnose reductase